SIMPAELPLEIKTVDDQLEFFLRPAGVARRMVELTGNWHKDGIGPLLGNMATGQVVALIPGKMGGYTYFDHEKQEKVKVTRKNAKDVGRDAYCFYNPLPTKKIGVGDLLKYMYRCLSPADSVMVVLCVLSITLLGLLTPWANQQLFGRVIPYGEASGLLGIGAMLVGATIATALIQSTRYILRARINTKVNMAVQPAAMSRLLNLPTSFFKENSSGEAAQRMTALTSLCGVMTHVIFGAGIVSLFSIIYIGQIAMMAPALALPAMLIIVANLVITVLNALVSMKVQGKQMESSAKLQGVVFSLVSGVQKLKLSGSERRAFAKWADRYSENAALTFTPPMFMRIATVLSTTVTVVGTIILFGVAAANNVGVAEYMAFSASFGLVSGAFMSLAGIAVEIAQIKPVLDIAKPIMDTVPETSEGKRMITRLSGSIDVNNVSFRYSPDMPLVLDDLSLKIGRGQYVAIVGGSGSGKSTLLRLLLGFEMPQKGAIYYDGNDMKDIDLKSLRKSVGCVIQNGTLMSGSIYENIVISAPHLTMDQAWEAAEMAGVADDIRAMPMGMHTLVAEGGGGFSGGQRQRLLIARAIAPKPKILFLDEATSALDNITQKHASSSLDGLKCTRLVIAHRLSTIRQCDRIIMLEGGKIAEDGTYDDLMALGGKFAELVERQKLEE
ncbi:MAG: NHLP bacteriocin export ABC transporter permease/ATPase subunit, partial [Defluviitaleaceae bacterium]|nr:NHLP bacteriocin export ABC transporter permease/ATPase subunit [Defluviitaleaceae bacterium]